MLGDSIMLRYRDVLVGAIYCNEMLFAKKYTTHTQHATATCDCHMRHGTEHATCSMLCDCDLGSWTRKPFAAATDSFGNGGGIDVRELKHARASERDSESMRTAFWQICSSSTMTIMRALPLDADEFWTGYVKTVWQYLTNRNKTSPNFSDSKRWIMVVRETNRRVTCTIFSYLTFGINCPACCEIKG